MVKVLDPCCGSGTIARAVLEQKLAAGVTPSLLGALPNSLVSISAGTVRRSGMDFVADQLFDRQKIQAFTIVDNYSRQCVTIHVGQSLKGDDVVAVMNQLKMVNLSVPERIQVDNGSEFISKVLELCKAACAGL